MPAINAGGTVASNPSLGSAVIMSSFAGPKGSPFDAKRADYSNPDSMTRIADPANLSTGALSTGIGFGSDVGVAKGFDPSTNAYTIDKVGVLVIPPSFNDDYIPGVTQVKSAGLSDAGTSVLVAIGGGKSTAPSEAAGTTGIAATVPYTAGYGLLGFGQGGSRDAGAGPAFTGFEKKMVTATAGVANGAPIETGWVNRSGGSMVSGMSEFGSSTAASAAPA